MSADLTAAIARYSRLHTDTGGQGNGRVNAGDTSFQSVLAQASTSQSSTDSSATPAVIGSSTDPLFGTTRKVVPMSAEERAAAKAAQAQATYKAAQEKLVEWGEKSYVEKLREIILEEMNLTEEELAAKPPEEREAIEHEIERRIKERLGQLEQKADENSLAGMRYLSSKHAGGAVANGPGAVQENMSGGRTPSQTAAVTQAGAVGDTASTMAMVENG